jgi:hypothetical protein
MLSTVYRAPGILPSGRNPLSLLSKYRSKEQALEEKDRQIAELKRLLNTK